MRHNPRKPMKTQSRLHMFRSESRLCYTAWGLTESDAAVAIRRAYPDVGRLVYLGAQ